DSASLVRALSHENLFWRLTAQRLLVEREKTDAVPALLEQVRNQSQDELGLNGGAIHALWSLHGLGLLDGSREDVTEAALEALGHPSPAVRLTAIRVLPRSDIVRNLLADQLSDPDAHVRLEPLLALSETARDQRTGQAI